MDAYRQKKEGFKHTRVGVITPYRQQRKCLQDTFQALCAENAQDVSILDCACFDTRQPCWTYFAC